MKIEEMPRASEGDTIELEGKVFRTKDPNSNTYDGEVVWGQFVVLKDDTGEQGCWLKLDSQEDKVTKGTQITVNGKLGKEYKDSRGKLKRSVNNCDFEVIGKVQEPAQSSSGNGTKDNYWEKKFKYEVERDPKVQLAIVRQSALKNVTEYVVAKIVKLADRFKYAQEDVDFIFKDIDLMAERSKALMGGETREEPREETKKERTKKAEGIVGETRFKPASTRQKEIIFGYTDKKGYHKGMIDSRYIETDEIKKIGDPKKLSVEDASEWIEFWWGEQGNPEDVGARKQREIDNPRNENGKLVKALVKGDKESLVKQVLVDEIYALRREQRLNDNERFEKEMGYNPKIEELTEAECIKLKGLLKKYVPF